MADNVLYVFSGKKENQTIECCDLSASSPSFKLLEIQMTCLAGRENFQTCQYLNEIYIFSSKSNKICKFDLSSREFLSTKNKLCVEEGSF